MHCHGLHFFKFNFPTGDFVFIVLLTKLFCPASFLQSVGQGQGVGGVGGVGGMSSLLAQ